MDACLHLDRFGSTSFDCQLTCKIVRVENKSAQRGDQFCQFRRAIRFAATPVWQGTWISETVDGADIFLNMSCL